ncbi:ABC transporter substrate-binding protein [Rhodococcus opacus]|uniref:ABC transporter substrate-binding protein n=1 Tax=Rhodococcus opacus TaxID=37919 RepID=UPI001C46DC21|nr:ABC transporter substrate-binding protein [Rhodococcus opacus]MBV6756689.1 ABC transporter substrate-binding protein [Rhodococcus opacus]
MKNISRTKGRVRRAAVALASSLMVLSALTACGGGGGAAEALSPENPQTVRVGVLNPMNSPEYIPVVARDKGFFAEEGINAELVPVMDILTATLAGDIDISSMGIQATIAMSRGQDLKYLGTLFPRPTVAVLVPPNSPILEHKGDWRAVMESLRGKNLGVTVPGAVIDNLTRYMADKAGVVPDQDITIQAAGSASTLVANLERGTYDAGVVPSPLFEKMLARGTAVSVLDIYAGEGPEEFKTFPYASPSATSRYLDRHPGVAEAYNRAIQKAIDWTKNPVNRPELLNILAKATGNPPESLNAEIDTMIGVLDSASYTKSAWDTGAAVLGANGIETSDLNYEDEVLPFARG